MSWKVLFLFFGRVCEELVISSLNTWKNSWVKPFGPRHFFKDGFKFTDFISCYSFLQIFYFFWVSFDSLYLSRTSFNLSSLSLLAYSFMWLLTKCVSSLCRNCPPLFSVTTLAKFPSYLYKVWARLPRCHWLVHLTFKGLRKLFFLHSHSPETCKIRSSWQPHLPSHYLKKQRKTFCNERHQQSWLEWMWEAEVWLGLNPSFSSY